MTLTPSAATGALIADLKTVIGPATVTTDTTTASAAAASAMGSVLVAAPRMTMDHASVTYTWHLVVIAPRTDTTRQDAEIDRLLTRLDTCPNLDIQDADPVTFTGSQAMSLPAYQVTATRTYTRH